MNAERNVERVKISRKFWVKRILKISQKNKMVEVLRQSLTIIEYCY